MASKDEYYQRVIASLQSEINSLKTIVTEQGKVIEEHNSTIVRQQKEIDSLKASKNPDRSSLYERLTGADKAFLLQRAKTECDSLIQTRLELLSTRYVEKREFDTFRKNVSAYLHTDTFTAYRKSMEIRLKSIEEKLNHPISILSFTHYLRKRSDGHKTYILLDSITLVSLKKC